MKGERILITGGAGFVGSGLARRCHKLGGDVHLFVRPHTPLDRLADFEATIHQVDLTDQGEVADAVRRCRPERVFHLAAHGTCRHQRDRLEICRVNFLGTAHLLDALASGDYRSFVNVGSSSEYGHKNGPIFERDSLEPRTWYAAAKAGATLLCGAEAATGRPITTVRVFSAYGPHDEASRLVPSVMESCSRGVHPQVTSGEQPRDYIFIEDIVDLLLLAADCPAAIGQVLHAGTGRQSTVREVVEMIVSICGVDGVQAEFGGTTKPGDEPLHWCADIERTTAITGWRPRHDLRSGLVKTWIWFQAQQLQAVA